MEAVRTGVQTTGPDSRGGRSGEPGWREELAWAAAVWGVALAGRAAVQATLPTVPVSDFRTVLAFAQRFASGEVEHPLGYWRLVNPGVPLLVAPWLRWIPAPPEAVGRWLSVLASSALPLIPLLGWHGVVPPWTRRLAAALLALWPGSILTAGLLSQDTWVLLPTVALATLAVRSVGLAETAARGEADATGGSRLAGDRPGRAGLPSSRSRAWRDLQAPVVAAALWGLAVSIRQEMGLVLLPLAVPAAGLWPLRCRPWRGMVAFALLAAASLGALGWLRHRHTGRFALTTQHAGVAMLGAYQPGVGTSYWANPWPYLAAVEPAALASTELTDRAARRWTFAEVRRRPLFHAYRVAGSTLLSLARSGTQSTTWSLGRADVVPPGQGDRALRLFRLAQPLLVTHDMLVHGLFLIALVLTLLARHPAVPFLASAICLKIAVHAVVVPQGRYFVVVTTMELLVVALGALAATRRRPWSRLLPPAAAGLAALAALALAGRWAHGRFVAGIEDVPRHYAFTLRSPDGEATLDCRMPTGRLLDLSPEEATILPFARQPRPGDRASATCQARRMRGNAPLVVRVRDAWAGGNLPGRVLQRVRTGGQTRWEHDLAAQPDQGWCDVPVGEAADGEVRDVTIEVEVRQPDPVLAGGPAATSFRIALGVAP